MTRGPFTHFVLAVSAVYFHCLVILCGRLGIVLIVSWRTRIYHKMNTSQDIVFLRSVPVFRIITLVYNYSLGLCSRVCNSHVNGNQLSMMTTPREVRSIIASCFISKIHFAFSDGHFVVLLTII